jgi:predicted GIY-YIG superfamily endonuclease
MRDRPQKVFHVYIMASRPRGVLYVGMTSDLARVGST